MDIKEITNSFEEELIENDYKIFNDNWYGAIRLFQKPVRDELGIKYYLHCYHYNFGLKYDGQPIHDSYFFKVQFDIEKENSVEISYSGEHVPEKNTYNRSLTSLREVEKFFNKQFKILNADYKEIKK